MEGYNNMTTGFFEENEGTSSSMRLMCFLSLLASIGFGLLTILRNSGDVGIYITMGFLLGAFAPKALQKFVEKK